MKAIKSFGHALLLALVFLVVCGILFPLFITGVGRLFFNKQANGSMVTFNGQVAGSELIGQDFTLPQFMKCRPSAVAYNTYTEEDKTNGTYTGLASGSDNFAQTNPELAKRVEKDIASFLKANPELKQEELPGDLFTASGSGLDPHISLEAANIQLPALAKATGLTIDELAKIVDDNKTEKFLGIFGEETVNVLGVNLAIAKATKMLDTN